MSTLRLGSLIVPSLLALALTPPAHANHDRPGSLLLFPEYDHRAGEQTLLTVTNTFPDQSISFTIAYISEACLEFNRSRTLTAGDTISVLTSVDSLGGERGFAYCYATNPASGQAVSFNELIGSAIRISSPLSYAYAYNAIAYEAIGEEGSPTDLDADGVRDLDGLEYQKSPDRLVFPSFVGETGFYGDSLVLIGLAGGQFQHTIDLLVWNDNEEVFSAQYAFGCWTKAVLSQVSPAFTRPFLLLTNQNPQEINGTSVLETGWFVVDGGQAYSPTVTIVDPAVLAMQIHTSKSTSFVIGGQKSTHGALLPFYKGEQDNGDLFPSAAGGDR
jgi:hypothetical protein